MGEFGFGQSVRRKEDVRLLTGRGCFIEDRNLPGQAHAALLRSPHAHARLVAIDAAAALTMPGVLAVLTGADLEADRIGTIPASFKPPVFPGSPQDTPVVEPPYPALARDRVRFVGDPVALVVAETREQAREAVERIVVEYDPLPSVTETADAASPDAPRLWEAAPGNVAFAWYAGDAAAVEAGFTAARHVVRLELINNRIVAAAMETRGALGAFDAATDRYTLYTASQMPHGLRDHLAHALGVPDDAVRVVIGDVGGGFGLKNALYPEQLLVLWAARRLERPVKWIGERAEAFLSDYQGRDHVTRAALALDAEHRFLALRVDTIANLGAYLSPKGVLSPTSNTPALAGPYRTPAIHVAVTGVFTNTVPTDVYRGAGRPEAIYTLERLVDAAARDLGVDPAELRRRNLVTPDEMPFQTPLGLVYDSGDFAHVLDEALRRAGREGFAARRAESAPRGKLRGLGFSHYVERVAGGWPETSELELHPDGRATAYLGTMSNGQGHETAYAQLVADVLGLGIDEVEVVQGDTDRVRSGHGTGGSASLPIAGAALARATDAVIERCRRTAGEMLETATVDIEFADGCFRVAGTDRSVSLKELAKTVCAAEAGGGPIREEGHFKPAQPTFPNGCHACEIEIDPETGTVEIVAYTMVHDFGRVLNPMLLQGQLHGGVAQGIGQAALERVAVDPESGQPLAGSFMDYCVPRADDLPCFAFAATETPSSNPLGVKGCGEAGAAGAPPAFVNAVVDALAPLGVRHVDMPVTPERLWRAIREARAAAVL
ncbi:MAG TPA: xanthine dehydrogenase family protein molybdopterin-binding subunit [Stellaceae bacterium]